MANKPSQQLQANCKGVACLVDKVDKPQGFFNVPHRCSGRSPYCYALDGNKHHAQHVARDSNERGNKSWWIVQLLLALEDMQC